MQKISTYLYPNRIELLADLAGFTTEFTNVYQRLVKIYNGIDNTLEFDIKNADQKRIDLSAFTSIQLNVMDASGQALPNSPYTVTPLNQTTLKGLASSTIPQLDLADLNEQYLTYSVTANKDGNQIMLYGDTRFGASGKMQLLRNAMPVTKKSKTYDSFTAEIDLKGVPTYHSSAIPTKFYEAIPTNDLTFSVDLKGFTGSVWIEGTKRSTINAEAFKGAPYIISTTLDNFTGTWSPDPIVIGEYQYLRVSYTTPYNNGIGSSFKVDRADGNYTVTLRAGGTGYAVNSQMKILGSVLGGVDGVNDLIITVTGIDGNSGTYPSSYTVSAITGFTWTGTAADGVGTYIASGTNITGTVDKVIVV